MSMPRRFNQARHGLVTHDRSSQASRAGVWMPQIGIMNESAVIQSVLHAFSIRGRGVVLVPSGPWRDDIRVGESLVLIPPSNVEIQSKVDGIEHLLARQSPDQRFGILVGGVHHASDVPSGTIICSIQQTGKALVIDCFRSSFRDFNRRITLVLDPDTIRGTPEIAQDSFISVSTPSGATIKTRGIGLEGAAHVSAIMLPDWEDDRAIERLSIASWR